ncbi:capsid protein VP2 [Protoparvovirus eulipotyphla1]|nr:capsid protein VP2 [Protoparvovirus eulipotyphla1]BAR42273.1 capsid protein VP2 [Protoparvovirus eulipotyphla1]
MDGGTSTDTQDEPNDAAATASNTGTTGGGGGGGSGVGHSTGNFDNRTDFRYENGEVTIICRATRLVHVKMSDSEEYRIFQTNNGDQFPPSTTRNEAGITINDSYHAECLTPWNLVNCNSWGCWMSPADFQHMSTICTEIDIQSLEQQIDNIVIKTVTTQGTGQEQIQLYNNDLTALLELALDKSNILPWTSDNGYLECLGYFPWRPSVPRPFRYYVNYFNAILIRPPTGPTTSGDYVRQRQGIQFDNVQFITVENHIPIELLRTGDSWYSGVYKFKCKPCCLSYHWQSSRHIGNPHPCVPPTDDTSLGQILAEGVTGWQWGNRASPIADATKVRDFHIGMSFPEWYVHYSSGGPVVNPGSSFSMLPFVPNGAPYDGVFNEGASRKIVFDYGHGNNDANTNTVWCPDVRSTGQTDWGPRNMIAGAIQNQYPQGQLNPNANDDNGYTTQQYTTNTFSPFTAVDSVGPIYPWGEIWTKKPNTEHQPTLSAQAPFICQDNAPGQLLVKLAPNYTDEVTMSGTQTKRIVTYATFWWSGVLVFKGKLRTPRQFNTYNMKIEQGYIERSEMIPNGIGNIELPGMHARYLPNFTM